MALDLETGEEAGGAEEEKPKRGRPSNKARAGELQRLIREQLDELAEWIGKRDDELGSILREDAERIAKVLATRAGKHARFGRALAVVFAPDGPLGILRAFGRTARVFTDRLSERRRANAAAVDAEGFLVDPETGQRILDETGAPIRGDA